MINFPKLVLKESLFGSPFASVKKQDPITMGAAALMAGGSLLGGLLGLGGTSNTNRQNLQIARETNASNEKIANETNWRQYQIAQEANQQNYRMFQEQNQWNLEQWNRENEYNSPKEQVARLKAAGINPAFANGMTTGNASSLESANSAPANVAQMQRAEMTAPQMMAPDFSFVGQSVNAALNAELMKTEINKKKSEVAYNDVLREFEVKSMMDKLLQEKNRAKYGSVEYEQANENLKLFKDVYDFNVRQMRGTAMQTEKQVDALEEQIATAKISRQILALDLNWKDKLNEASYQSLKAGIAQAFSAARLNDQKSLESVAREAVEKARENGLKISNREASRIEESIVEKATYEADEAYWKSYNEMQKSHGVFKRLFGSSSADAQPYVHDRYSRREHTKSYINNHKNEVLW